MNYQRVLGRAVFTAVIAGCLATTASALAPLQDGPRKVRQTAPPPPADQPAKSEQLPEADAVLRRHIDAVGGEEAIRKLDHRSATGEFEYVGMGAKGTVKIHQAAPNDFLLEMEIPGQLRMTSGYNGEVAWSIDPISGPRLLEKELLEEMQKDADFYGDLNFAERYPERTTVGKEEFAGKSCYKLKLKTASGRTQDSYYAIDTGLFAGYKGEIVTLQGKLNAIIQVDDYKTVDGIKIPHKLTTVLPDQHMTQTIVMHDISHAEFPHDVFNLPKPIQTLVEDQHAADAGKTESPKPATNEE